MTVNVEDNQEVVGPDLVAPADPGKNEEVLTDKELNFKNLRDRLEAERIEKERLRMEVEQLQGLYARNASQQVEPQPERFKDDDLIEGRHFNALAAEMQELKNLVDRGKKDSSSKNVKAALFRLQRSR